MSGYLQPSFLLELGAYAVAAAGIRIFKSRYWRAGTQISADNTSKPEEPVATVQSGSLLTPPTVLGLGQASPLRAPTSPRRSESPALQTEPQLATPVAPQPLHAEDTVDLPTRRCPLPSRQPSNVVASGSTSGFDMQEAGPDVSNAEAAEAGATRVFVPEGPAGALLTEKSFPERVAAEAMAAQPQEATERANQTIEQRRAAQAAHAERQRLRRASQTAEQQLLQRAGHAARQMARRASPIAEQLATALAANDTARRGDRLSVPVSEPTSAAEVPADPTGMQIETCTTAASQHDRQPASEILATTSEDGPTFKVVYVGDGGTTKVCGADLMAWGLSSAAGISNLNAPAEPTEDGSQDKAEATNLVQEQADEEDVSPMCESSDEEEEGVCAGTNKDHSPLGFDLHSLHAVVPSSSTGAQRDSSAAAGLVTHGSESDGELQPAEEAVVTHRDILLRAAQRCKRELTDSHRFMSDTGISIMTDSRKKPCGSCAAGHTPAGFMQAMRASSLDTSCMSGSNDGTHHLPAELPVACVPLKDRQPTPSGGDVTPPGVDQDPIRGLNSTPASSDRHPQPPEEGQDQCLVSSRATAPRSGGFLPIAGSVFDEAPSPETEGLFDNALMDAVMFDDAEEEEHRHASPEQPVDAMEDDLACEEEQGQSLQELDQATADVTGQPTDPSPASPIGAAEAEEQTDVQLSLRECPSPQTLVLPHPRHSSPKNRLYQDEGREWRSSGKPWQPIHSHEPDYSSSGNDNDPDAEPSADTDHPGEHDPAHPAEHEQVYQSGSLTKDQCTWEPVDGKILTYHPQHDSPEHHAPAGRPQEADWACVLPRLDSAPPVSPDSPDYSSAPPKSPSWGLSDDPWGSPSRAAPNSRPKSAWDSPPGAAPDSPALACARARSGRSRRYTAPRAVSSSPAPRARSPYEAPWHTPPRSQATTPMRESTPPSAADPYGGGVAQGLDGDYAYGSYAYTPAPPTPTSPSPPPGSPPYQSGVLPYETFYSGISRRSRAPAFRVLALESSSPVPASPESPPHHEEPGRAAPDSPALVAPDDTQFQGEEEKHDQEAAVEPTPLAYSYDIEAWQERAAAMAADKPYHHEVAEEGATAIKQGAAIKNSSKHPYKHYKRQAHWPEPSSAEAQTEEADPEGLGTEQGQWEGDGQGQGPPLPLRLPSPLGRGKQGQAGVHGAGSAESMSPPPHPHPYPPHTQAQGGHLVDVCEGCGHNNQVTGKQESSLKGAAAAFTPEPVPDVQQSCEEEAWAAQAAWRAACRAMKQRRVASLSPQPSPEHPSESSPQPSSESGSGESPDSKIDGARGRHFDPDTGTPVSSDKDEQAAAVDDSPSEDQAGRAPDNGQQGGSNMGEAILRLEKVLAAYGSRQGASAATSPEPVDLLQAEEEEQVDGPGGDQAHEQDRPVAASVPQSEEPEMMGEDDEGQGCYEDEDVQFVSETGPDPSRSAFASAVKRLTAEEEEDVELLPGVQDLISGALGSKQARHSRRSVVDEDDDMSVDRSRGRGPTRLKRPRPTSPDARSSPFRRGRQGLGRRHGQRSHSSDRHQLFCEEDEDVSPGRAVSVYAATVSAAASSHAAGAAAAALGSHARRLRDMLCVAEEEDEEDDMDADLTCWRKLLKKSRHH